MSHAGLAAVSWLAGLAACPDCPPVQQARALVFAAGFWRDAMAVVLPFALIALAVQRFVRHLDRRTQDDQDSDAT